MAIKETKSTNPLIKWGLIVGGIIFLLFGIMAVVFIFVLPSFMPGEEGQEIPVDIPEVVIRIGIVLGIFIVAVLLLAGIAYVLYMLFFRKKEIHIVKEHMKILKEVTQLNPAETLGSLVLSGKGKIQHYEIGRIAGHTQVPVKFERYVILDKNGAETPMSETQEEFDERIVEAQAAGRDRYDFFAFVTGRGFYAFPIFSLFEPVKIFACYPCERSPDLIGDVEIYDIGVWKYYSVLVPAQRAQEPLMTLEDLKNQIMPIAVTSLMDYVGLVAQRGIEGDTGLQKWLESKASLVNIKQTPS